MKLTKTHVTRTIWIAVIACTSVLLVPVVANVLLAEFGTAAADAGVSAPEDITLPAIEYDPAVGSYPVPG